MSQFLFTHNKKEIFPPHLLTHLEILAQLNRLLHFYFVLLNEVTEVCMSDRFRATFIILLFQTILLTALHAQENYQIRHVSFEGNNSLSKELLVEEMSLKGLSVVEKKVSKKEYSLYNKELINLDMQRLVRFYQSEGFIEAKALVAINERNDDKKWVKLNVSIIEGNPILIDTLTFQIKQAQQSINTDSILKRLLQNIELVKGIRFRDESLQNDLYQIEDVFRNMGYAYVKVTYTLNLKPKKHSTAIHYTVNTGPICTIGETKIVGTKHVSESFIRKQLKFKSGDVYNKSLLTETRYNLYQLQLFKVVSVLPQTNASESNQAINVQIYIEETPRLGAHFGAGYGTEDQFRAFLDANYRGVFGGARRMNLYLKHSALMPYSASLSWIQPQFLSPVTSISINPFLKHNIEPGYDIRSYGINIPFTYKISKQLNSTLSYYLEKIEQKVEAGDALIIDQESEKFPYNKSGLQWGTMFNNANPKFSPTEGFVISTGLKLNGYVLGGDFNYTRLWGDFRAYHKVLSFVLAYRIMAGGISSSDESGFVPVEDRFYSGGSYSIRGWYRSELGVKRTSGSPLGGKSVLETNIELRQHLFWRIDGVAFIDAGNVWTNAYTFPINELAYATGAGLRIETPIGPIRFDMGYPIFNVKKTPAFFISVGQAF